MRIRHEGSLEDTMDSTTPRAVLLSAMTTLAAFGSLTLSSHRGIGSLGLLLSVSVVFLVYSTVVALPALLLVLGKTPAASGPTEPNA
jgi:predicted RND superfamily exporter protein